MALGVDLRAAAELPAEQRTAQPVAAPLGMHPALEVDPEGVAEGRRREHGGPGGQRAVVVEDRDPVPGQVDEVVDPPLGQVVGVGVLAGVVEFLGGGEEVCDVVDVVRAQRARGEALGQEQLGHGRRG